MQPMPRSCTTSRVGTLVLIPLMGFIGRTDLTKPLQTSSEQDEAPLNHSSTHTSPSRSLQPDQISAIIGNLSEPKQDLRQVKKAFTGCWMLPQQAAPHQTGCWGPHSVEGAGVPAARRQQALLPAGDGRIAEEELAAGAFN